VASTCATSDNRSKLPLLKTDQHQGVNHEKEKKTGITALAAAAIFYTASMAFAQVCVVEILMAAAYLRQHENRELTSNEAMTRGLSYLFEKRKQKTKPKIKKSPAAPSATDRAATFDRVRTRFSRTAVRAAAATTSACVVWHALH